VIDDNAATTESAVGVGTAPTLTDTAKAPVAPSGAQPTAGGMRVKKRSGALEPVDVNKIVNAIARASEGLLGVDPMRVATRTISALADGATTRELDDLSIRTAAGLIVEEPNYSKLASRLLATVIDKEVRNQNIPWFSESIAVGHAEGLVSDQVLEFVNANAPCPQCGDRLRSRPQLRVLRTAHRVRPLPAASPLAPRGHRDAAVLLPARGLRAVHRRRRSGPLLRPDVLARLPAVEPDAVQLRHRAQPDVELLPARLARGQPRGHLQALHRHRQAVEVRRRHRRRLAPGARQGQPHPGHQRLSNGIVPWLRTLDSSVAAVNQGGRRKGAACVYLESWHADIEDFLELRDNTGDHARRTHNLNIANWIPDLFMERVEKDWQWSLFDPKQVPHLTDLFGDDFERAYVAAEEAGLYEKQVPARQLYSKMMRTLAQTGNGWVTFKDASNEKCNQTGEANDDGTPRVVHLSNLCTEILEITDQQNTAVCNLGSLNLGAYVDANAEFDYAKLGEVVRQVVPLLDRVIDINYYPTSEAEFSNHKWRPVGLGLMGLQDVFFKKGLAFDSADAKELSRTISAHIYFHALWASTELAEANGPHEAFEGTRAAKGDLQFDLWDKANGGVTPPAELDWDGLRARIATHGLRNSLLIAIAPTATIASIVGCYECIEPQVSNLFKRETLSGEFMQINRYLVRELQDRGLWDEQMINDIKRAEGSVQEVDRIPDELKEVFRTAWEIPQRALIDMAAERGAFIDQSQSLNLFIETPTIGKLSSMYLHAWKAGLKTTYYLRSRPATRINQSTTSTTKSAPVPSGGGQKSPAAESAIAPLVNEADTKTYTDEEAIACSLENPESCEACD
jgi:ribonucleoside-diphosphate reductase alpha chain